MSKLSVTRAFDATVTPNLTAIGFRRCGSKRYVRVRSDICQFLLVHVESRIKREFMLEYSAMLLCQPHNHENLELGGKFPDGKIGRWYPSHGEDRLTESVTVIADQLSKTLFPWYDGCITLQGFIDTYRKHAHQQHPTHARNGHTEFTLACAHARNNDLAAAATHARQAIADYKAIYKERPICDWANDGAALSSQLLESLELSTVEKLLAQWRSRSIEALKLAPAIGPDR